MLCVCARARGKEGVLMECSLQSMRKNGNARSNAYFNPDPHKHPPPVSQEDADSHMERHIRAKYEYRTFRPQGNGAGSSSSDATVAGGASAAKSSSSSRRRKLEMALFRTSSPGGQGKVNQILGTNNAPYTDSRSAPGPVFPHGMAAPTRFELYGEQIKSLSEMGFTDVNQCLEVLMQTDGKMMEAVEILIRLNKAEDRRPEPPPKNGLAVQVHKSGPAAVLRHSVSLTIPATSSSNPFDELDKEQPPLPPLPLSQARTGGSVPSAHPMFFQQTQQPFPVQQQAWHSQLLGYPQQQPPPQQQQFAVPQNNNNPFGAAPISPAPMQYPASTGSTYNPYMSALPSNPYQQLQLPPQQQPQPQLQTNPYQQFQQQQPQFQQQQQFFNPQQHQPQPQSIDKSQILALFNAPQLAPPRSEMQIEVTSSQPLPQAQQSQQQQQMPQAASNNPFLPATVQSHSHRSQESVDFGAWQSGRHSPDAFASLAFGGR